MHPKVKELRATLSSVDGVWVRRWRSGEIWAGSERRSEASRKEIEAILSARGIAHHCYGKPGTVGEHIVTIDGA